MNTGLQHLFLHINISKIKNLLLLISLYLFCISQVFSSFCPEKINLLAQQHPSQSRIISDKVLTKPITIIHGLNQFEKKAFLMASLLPDLKKNNKLAFYINSTEFKTAEGLVREIYNQVAILLATKDRHLSVFLTEDVTSKDLDAIVNLLKLLPELNNKSKMGISIVFDNIDNFLLKLKENELEIFFSLLKVLTDSGFYSVALLTEVKLKIIKEMAESISPNDERLFHSVSDSMGWL